MNVFEQKNAELVTEFDRYVREHPDFAEPIPDTALVAMLVEGDEEFNRWSQEGAKRQAEKGQPIVYVKIKRMQPVRSRIQEINDRKFLLTVSHRELKITADGPVPARLRRLLTPITRKQTGPPLP